MTKHQRRVVRELEESARRDGLEHHLEAAKALSRDGVDAETIRAMMRFMYSRAEIRALIAAVNTTEEAQHQTA